MYIKYDDLLLQKIETKENYVPSVSFDLSLCFLACQESLMETEASNNTKKDNQGKRSKI